MICAPVQMSVSQHLKQNGYGDAQLYDPTETSVRGIHAFFLILGEPEAYGLPPKPQVPTIYLKSAWIAAFATAIASIIATLLAFRIFLYDAPNNASSNCASKHGRRALSQVAVLTLSVDPSRANPVTTDSR